MKLSDEVANLLKPDRGLDWAIHVRNGLEGVGAYGAHPYYTSDLEYIYTYMRPEEWIIATLSDLVFDGLPGCVLNNVVDYTKEPITVIGTHNLRFALLSAILKAEGH